MEAGGSEQYAGESEPSAPAGPFDYIVPTWQQPQPAHGAVLEDLDQDGEEDDLQIMVMGESGAQVEVIADGSPIDVAVIGPGVVAHHVIPDVDVGERTFELRYVDPETGALGQVVTVTITVVEP